VLQNFRALQCWPLWIRLTLICAGLGAAYLLQIPLEGAWPGEPFPLFLLVVIGTTLCFGTRLGLVSAALSVFLSLYFFEPIGSPTRGYASGLNQIALYAILALGCVTAVRLTLRSFQQGSKCRLELPANCTYPNEDAQLTL
jgi:hypothetical protein